MKLKIFLFSLFVTLNLNAITLGENPKPVTIDKDNGGLVSDGSAWKSSSIKDKVYVVFYVDPDKKDVNEEFSKLLKKKRYDGKKFGSMAIINLAATWKPNFIIGSILKRKQKEFPRTIYVKDKRSVLVKEWGLKDNASDILIFSKSGKLLFYKAGKMSEDDIKKAISIIESNL